jgi:hypothetical protein
VAADDGFMPVQRTKEIASTVLKSVGKNRVRSFSFLLNIVLKES